MDRKTFKQICRDRTLCWGTVMWEHMDSQVVRTLARAEFDWIWIDNEHSYHSNDKLYQVIRTAEDLGIITLLRVRQGEYPFIAHAMDMAPSGIIVPRVETPEQMRNIVQAAKFPPVGDRGFGIRPSLFGKNAMSMQERIEDMNENRLLVVQLETPKAIGNIEAIADAADGQVDALFFGPADYQMAIGKPDNPFCDEVLDGARRLIEFSKKHNLSNGLPTTSVDVAKRWREIGFNLLTYKSDDQFLFDAMVEGRKAVKGID
jgi:4-hydroxy-2-oxoheptanedioate aldolase